MTIDITKNSMGQKIGVPTKRDNDLARMNELKNKTNLTQAEKEELNSLLVKYGDGPERAKAASHSAAPNLFSGLPNNNNNKAQGSIFN